jgi:hypothetical protein
MQTMRDFWGAWLIVGALGLAIVGIWGSASLETATDRAVACADGVTQETVGALHGAEVPHNGWRPSPELTGLPPAGGDRLTSYEVAEQRNLEAVGATRDAPVHTAHGSITSLNPTSMC